MLVGYDNCVKLSLEQARQPQGLKPILSDGLNAALKRHSSTVIDSPGAMPKTGVSLDGHESLRLGIIDRRELFAQHGSRE